MSSSLDRDPEPESAPSTEGPHLDYYAVFWDVPMEPDLTELFPAATRTTYDLDGGREAWLDVVEEGDSRDLIQWWRANGSCRLGGKDGARFAMEDDWVQYDVPALDGFGETLPQVRLRMTAKLDDEGTPRTRPAGVPDADPALDEEALERLRNLGYID